MPSCLLGLEINPGYVAGVRVRRRLRGWKVLQSTRVELASEKAWPEGLETLFERLDPSGAACAVAIPAGWLLIRNLRLPFSEEAKIRQTLAYEMEPLLPLPLGELAVDFCRSDGQGALLAAALPRSRLAALQDALQKCGVDPQVVDASPLPLATRLARSKSLPPEAVLVELSGGGGACVFLQAGRPALLRPLAGCGHRAHPEAPAVFIRHTLHAFRSNSAPAYKPLALGVCCEPDSDPALPAQLARALELPLAWRSLEQGRSAAMDVALSVALSDLTAVRGFNFRRASLAPKADFSFGRRLAYRAALWACLAALLAGTGLFLEARLMQARSRRLQHEIESVFRATFPHVHRVVDPLRQARIEMQRLEQQAGPEARLAAGPTAIELLADLSRRIPPALDVLLERLVLDREAVRLSGQCDAFNSVDTLKGVLQDSPHYSAVTIGAAKLDREGKRVQFEITLRRHQAGFP